LEPLNVADVSPSLVSPTLATVDVHDFITGNVNPDPLSTQMNILDIKGYQYYKHEIVNHPATVRKW
jgi:hypothetical protein